MTNPPMPLTKKRNSKSSASSNRSSCSEPQANKLKIGMMSTRVGTIKKYSSNSSNLNKKNANATIDAVNKQTNVVSNTNHTSTSTTVVCPHCPKQFPRGGAWKIPQHISSAHPSSSHLSFPPPHLLQPLQV